MKAKQWGVLGAAIVGLLVSSVWFGQGCGLLLDPDPPGVTPTAPRAFLCEAQIYRDIGSEFTEEWRAWVFASDEVAATALCNSKIAEYIARAMAPGFAWSTRDLVVTEGTEADPDPLLRKKLASECASDETGPPFTTGGPLGADVVLDPPSSAEAQVVVTAELDGNVYFADPSVDRIVWRLAERHGFPGRTAPYDYGRLHRHLRIWDVFIEVVTPFSLGDVQIDELYIQGVGTIYADAGFPGRWFLETGSRAKLFFFGRGHYEDEPETSSFCIAGSGAPEMVANQGPGPDFGFDFFLLQSDLEGLPLTVSLSLGGIPGSPIPADEHQPYVRIASGETDALAVDLGNGPSNVFLDNDGDLARVLWFEDFETAGEAYLGEGLPLSIQVSPGAHEFTAVAYDSRGAYNYDDMTLTVNEPIAMDDMYTTEEDATLMVAAPGVLSNDTDAGVPRRALRVSDPTNGILTLDPTGSVVYTPNANFSGMDSFQYFVDYDGIVASNTATVEITVIALTSQEELERIVDICERLGADGVLNVGQTRSCSGVIEEAIDELDRGGFISACNKIQAFINHIETFVSEGVLTEMEAAPLLEGADNIRMENGCP